MVITFADEVYRVSHETFNFVNSDDESKKVVQLKRCSDWIILRGDVVQLQDITTDKVIYCEIMAQPQFDEEKNIYTVILKRLNDIYVI